VFSHCSELHNELWLKNDKSCNFFTEIATWILKCTFIAYHCLPPLRFHASLGILRWGNAFDQKLEVGEPRPIYTLTTVDIGANLKRTYDFLLVTL